VFLTGQARTLAGEIERRVLQQQPSTQCPTDDGSLHVEEFVVRAVGMIESEQRAQPVPVLQTLQVIVAVHPAQAANRDPSSALDLARPEQAFVLQEREDSLGPPWIDGGSGDLQRIATAVDQRQRGTPERAQPPVESSQQSGG
jgi:hypothetical protein